MRTTTALVLAVVVVALALALAPAPAAGVEMFTASDVDSDESMWALYEHWLVHYQHELARDEAQKQRRFGIFKGTVHRVYAAHPGDRHSVLGLNVFADRTTEETSGDYACQMPAAAADVPIIAKPVPATPPLKPVEPVPDSVDWRAANCSGHPCLGKVIRRHRGCGCCWAVAAVGALESLTAIRRGNGVVELSVQQLLDCSVANHGCSGGFAYKAYQYIVANGGLSSEADYPYVGVRGTCHHYPSAVSISGFSRVPSFHPFELMAAVRLQPVVVAIDASGNAFRDYPGGVYRGPCGHDLNHEMVLVGYGSTGTTTDDLDYCIVQNSWGQGWGEGGFMRILRNSDRDTEDTLGVCGIQMDSIFPNMN